MRTDHICVATREICITHSLLNLIAAILSLGELLLDFEFLRSPSAFCLRHRTSVVGVVYDATNEV